MLFNNYLDSYLYILMVFFLEISIIIWLMLSVS